jgi:N-acetylmuramoyl-L-alanine amidase
MRGWILFVLFGCLLPLQASAAPVALDVGHFLTSPGALSARGRPEFEFNRALAHDLKQALRRRGLDVLTVGEDGTLQDLSARAKAAEGARFLLSVHHDSVQPHYLQSWMHEGVERPFSDAHAGFSLFVSRLNGDVPRSLACASTIGAALRAAGFSPSHYHAEPISGESRPFADRANGVHYYDGLAVLKGMRAPAVLLEAGVIVNRREELALGRASVRKKMADAVAGAVLRCLP